MKQQGYPNPSHLQITPEQRDAPLRRDAEGGLLVYLHREHALVADFPERADEVAEVDVARTRIAARGIGHVRVFYPLARGEDGPGYGGVLRIHPAAVYHQGEACVLFGLHVFRPLAHGVDEVRLVAVVGLDVDFHAARSGVVRTRAHGFAHPGVRGFPHFAGNARAAKPPDVHAERAEFLARIDEGAQTGGARLADALIRVAHHHPVLKLAGGRAYHRHRKARAGDFRLHPLRIGVAWVAHGDFERVVAQIFQHGEVLPEIPAYARHQGRAHLGRGDDVAHAHAAGFCVFGGVRGYRHVICLPCVSGMRVFAEFYGRLRLGAHLVEGPGVFCETIIV